MTPIEIRSEGLVLPLRNGRYFSMLAFVYGRIARDWLGSVWRDGGAPWRICSRLRIAGQVLCPLEFIADGATEAELRDTLAATARGLVRERLNEQVDIVSLKTRSRREFEAIIARHRWRGAAEA